MIINITDVWARGEAAHRRYLDPIINLAVLQMESLHGACLVEEKVSKFISRNKEILIGNKADLLSDVILDFTTTFSNAAEWDAAIEICEYIFDYGKFSAKAGWAHRQWSAYKLCAGSQYLFCSYCHIAPVDTKMPTAVSALSYRPNIDHYYNKARYPYLSLTLANFVPCCERCNGSALKGDKDFFRFPHLNPLLDEQSIDFELSLLPTVGARPSSAVLFDNCHDNYEIRLIAAPANVAKATFSIRTFQLKERYEIFLETAFRLRRQLMTNASRRRMIDSELPFLNSELSDVVGFELTGDAYKNAPLGKLKLDVYRSVSSYI